MVTILQTTFSNHIFSIHFLYFYFNVTEFFPMVKSIKSHYLKWYWPRWLRPGPRQSASCSSCSVLSIHYIDIMATQITENPTFSFSTIYSGAHQRKQRASNTEKASTWWRHHEALEPRGVGVRTHTRTHTHTSVYWAPFQYKDTVQPV